MHFLLHCFTVIRKSVLDKASAVSHRSNPDLQSSRILATTHDVSVFRSAGPGGPQGGMQPPREQSKRLQQTQAQVDEVMRYLNYEFFSYWPIMNILEIK